MVCETNAPSRTALRLRVQVESKLSVGGNLYVYLWNWSTSAYVLLGGEGSDTAEILSTFLTSDHTNQTDNPYIRGGTENDKLIRAKLVWSPTIASQDPITAHLDSVEVGIR